MIPAIKAEFRKLFTIRSTYFVLLLTIALLGLFSFYIGGILGAANNGAKVTSSTLATQITDAVGATAILSAIVAMLLVTHEYRYSTILYTLTSAKSRLQVLLAKIVIISGFSLVFTAAVGTLAALLTALGLHIKHIPLDGQIIPIADLAWRVLFYGWGYSMLALLLAVIIRSQVGAIMTFFLFPSTLEPLLGILVKQNAAQYLPFRLLGSMLTNGSTPGVVSTIAHPKAALLFTAYLIGGWIITAMLFMRRDAN